MNEAAEQARRVQRIVGEVLIPEVRELQDHTQLTKTRTLPVALELYYTALSMKAAYRPGGLLIADRAAVALGFDPDELHEYAIMRINEVDAAL